MFVNEIKNLLQETGLSERAFAKRVKIDARQFNRYVIGENEPRQAIINKIQVVYPEFMRVGTSDHSAKHVEKSFNSDLNRINDLFEVIKKSEEIRDIIKDLVSAKDDVIAAQKETIETQKLYKETVFVQLKSIEEMGGSHRQMIGKLQDQVKELLSLKKSLVKEKA